MDLIRTIDDDEEVPEEPDSGSDDEADQPIVLKSKEKQALKARGSGHFNADFDFGERDGLYSADWAMADVMAQLKKRKAPTTLDEKIEKVRKKRKVEEKSQKENKKTETSASKKHDDQEEEEEEEEDDEEKAEEETGEQQEEESSVSDSTPKAGKKSTQEVNKEMDEKIAKLKHFLDRAKSKHFSAIRIPKGLSERVFTETVAKQNAAKNQQQKAVKQGKRRRAVEDEPAQPAKLTSKEKRRIERAQKVKKVGVRYYETHNVKNKNKNRKIPSDGKKANRAKR